MGETLKPLLVGQPNDVNQERLQPRLDAIFSSGHFTNFGPFEKQFSSQLQRYLSAKNVLLYANGHLALESLLSCIDGPGEIITSPYTFASTAHAIINQGFTPVFCDIEPNGVNLDPQHIEKAITPKTKAILGVHVFGVPCRHDEITEIARKNNILVLYDAAHCFGATTPNGQHLPTLGDASILSLHATKVFHSVEGGAVVCNSDKISGDHLQQSRNFGLAPNGDIVTAGANGKMSELHAAIGLTNLEDFGSELSGRRQVIDWYYDRLKDAPEFWLLAKNLLSNGAYFPIFLRGDEGDLASKRTEIIQKMRDQGISLRAYFSPALTDTTYFGTYASPPCPNASTRAKGSICLPINSKLSNSDVNRICDALLGVLQNGTTPAKTYTA